MKRLNTAPQYEPSPYARSLLNGAEPVLPTTSTTHYFADFASTYYHPRSLCPVLPPSPIFDRAANSNNQASSSASPTLTSRFSSFEAGADLFATRDAEVDVLDEDIRHWIEETDSLQAVQIFTSTDDAWSGFASKYVEKLRDELGKGCIWVWGIDTTADLAAFGSDHQASIAQHRERRTNVALAVTSFSEQASMFVPLALPKRLLSEVDLDRSSLWHTAGFLSAAVESVTMPTRLKEIEARSPTMLDWQDKLSSGGKRGIAALAFHPDFAIEEEGITVQKPDVHEDGEDDSLQALKINLSPDAGPSGSRTQTPPRNKTFARIETFRCSADGSRRAYLGEENLPSKSGLLLEK